MPYSIRVRFLQQKYQNWRNLIQPFSGNANIGIFAEWLFIEGFYSVTGPGSTATLSGLGLVLPLHYLPPIKKLNLQNKKLELQYLEPGFN